MAPVPGKRCAPRGDWCIPRLVVEGGTKLGAKGSAVAQRGKAPHGVSTGGPGTLQAPRLGSWTRVTARVQRKESSGGGLAQVTKHGVNRLRSFAEGKRRKIGLKVWGPGLQNWPRKG